MIKYLILLALLLIPVAAQANEDPCLQDNIDVEVSTRYDDLFRSTEGIEMLFNVNKRIDSGDITKEDGKILLKKELEDIIRKEHDCAVSFSMKEKLEEVDAMTMYEEEKLKTTCAPDLYVIQARAQYEAHKDTPEFEVLEKQIYKQVTKDTPSTALSAFDKNWENPEMRKKVAIAVFDMNLREKDGCYDPALPVTNTILELLEE